MPSKPVDFVVGDVITSYHNGFHRVTAIEDRSHKTASYKSESPLVHYVTLYNGQFKKVGGKASKASDAGFCKKLDGKYLTDFLASIEAMAKAAKAMYKDLGVAYEQRELS